MNRFYRLLVLCSIFFGGWIFANTAKAFTPTLSTMMGGNGAPSGSTTVSYWQQMGLRFSRLDIYPYGNSANKQDLINHGYLGDTTALDNQILSNNSNGITTLLMLGFGVGWNGTVVGDVNSKPIDESVWTGYVTAVVQKYSAAPYNVKYFQVWNEAAGSLNGGSLQSTFWHGPGYLNNLVASNSSLCLDTVNEGTSNGSLLQQTTCQGLPTQNYAKFPVGNGQFEIRSVSTGKCLDIPLTSGSITAGTQIQLNDCSGSSTQIWTFKQDSNGAYTFVSVPSNYCLGVAGGSTSAGAAVQVLSCSGSTSQKFNFKLSSAATAYANAMSDYVDSIHIPAAQIIRSYGGNVVYGGWPDQGGLSTYTQWLEYVSTNYNSRILDWTDYIDTHYYGVSTMSYLYNRYVATGKIKGVWQSEVGWDYMTNPNFIAQFYFNMAQFALNNNWTDPNQFVAMIYTIWGNGQAFLPLNNGSLTQTGQSLVTLNQVLSGTLGGFYFPMTYSSGSSVVPLYNGNQIVFQVQAPQGAASIDVTNFPEAQSFTVKYFGGIAGDDVSADITSATWTGGHLSIKLNVPAGSYDLNNHFQNYMGYVVVTPASSWVMPATPISPDDTMTPTNASYIIDRSNNQWTVSSGYIYKNGVKDPYSYNVQMLLWFQNNIYQENTKGQFYLYNYSNGTWSGVPDPRKVSISGTTVPSASYIIDNSKNEWTLSSGYIYKNGVKDPYSYNVQMLLWYQGSLYQENTTGQYYIYNNGIWTSTAKPN